MGAYGTPERHPALTPEHLTLSRRRPRRGVAFRVIQWSLAVIAACVAVFCVLVVIATIHAAIVAGG